MSKADRRWWRDWLGATADPHGDVRVVPSHLPVEPEWQTHDLELDSYGDRLVATVLRPAHPDGQPEPVVIVPFYEVATLFGRPCPRTAQRRRDTDQAYAWYLAREGFSVVAVPWWFEHVAAADPHTGAARTLHERYGPAARRHRDRHRITGLGRSLGDLLIVVDHLIAQPWVDPQRIGVFGHSLGAKLALHVAALDERVAAAVAHEPGLGLAHSNWTDPWYLGERVPPDRDHDALLALVAPRPFLLCGGGDGDGPHNRDLAEAARPAWGEQADLHLLYHDGGHPMPPHVIAAATTWLRGHLVAAAPPASSPAASP